MGLLQIVYVQDAEQFSATQQRSAHRGTKTSDAHAFAATKTFVGGDIGDQNGLLLRTNAIQDCAAENDMWLAGASRLRPAIANLRLPRNLATLVEQHHESAFDSLDAEGKVHDLLRDAVASGDLAKDTDAELLADALVGPIVMRRLMFFEPFDPKLVPALVDSWASANNRPSRSIGKGSA